MTQIQVEKGGKLTFWEERGGGEEAQTPCTYILNKKRTSGVENKLVGVKHLSAVNLELDITQMWVVDHGPKVSHQQPNRQL